MYSNEHGQQEGEDALLNSNRTFYTIFSVLTWDTLYEDVKQSDMHVQLQSLPSQQKGYLGLDLTMTASANISGKGLIALYHLSERRVSKL